MGMVKLVHLAFDGFAVHVFVDLPADVVLVRRSQIDLLQTLVICIQTVLSVENNLIASTAAVSLCRAPVLPCLLRQLRFLSNSNKVGIRNE